MRAFAENYPRVGGLFLFLISLLLAKFCVYDPWQSAVAHAPNVSLHMKAVVISVTFCELGLGLAIFGNSFKRSLNDPNTGKPTMLGWLVVAAMLGPAFGFYFWFERQISALGYTF